MTDRLNADLDTAEQAGQCARCHRWAALRLYDTSREDEGGCAWLCPDCAA